MRRPDDIHRKRGRGDGPPDREGAKLATIEEPPEQVEARRAWNKDRWDNRIDWFVDILGTMPLLDRVIRGRFARDDEPLLAVNLDESVVQKRAFQRLKHNQEADIELDGVLFTKGHWYSCRDGELADSYKRNYQIRGTAHFCQTFATMIYLGETDDLVDGTTSRGGWGWNVRQAVQFWRTQLKERDIHDYFIREIQTSDWAEEKKDRWIPADAKETSFIPLADISRNELASFLTLLEANVESVYQTETS